MTRTNVVPLFEPARGAFCVVNPARGYSVLYRGAQTPCPGCGRSHWYVGRFSCECAFCATALPMSDGGAL